ncbi:hypothetical protein FTUN_5697 [Frigoriglobus tundricola]|uniref:Uncharacterized protein n=1 Tax=Frigoriglobus tundricola TaxID=2774151 RepID=A0A6M5YVL1_9BACT|nr:hypothetical protein FTUN_5697 [Frigoriglobus tundricola]
MVVRRPKLSPQRHKARTRGHKKTEGRRPRTERAQRRAG